MPACIVYCQLIFCVKSIATFYCGRVRSCVMIMKEERYIYRGVIHGWIELIEQYHPAAP